MALVTPTGEYNVGIVLLTSPRLPKSKLRWAAVITI